MSGSKAILLISLTMAPPQNSVVRPILVCLGRIFRRDPYAPFKATKGGCSQSPELESQRDLSARATLWRRRAASSAGAGMPVLGSLYTMSAVDG